MLELNLDSPMEYLKSCVVKQVWEFVEVYC